MAIIWIGDKASDSKGWWSSLASPAGWWDQEYTDTSTADDLLAPVIDDGPRKKRRRDLEWMPGLLEVAAVVDLLAPTAQDEPRRKRDADSWPGALPPDLPVFAQAIDDGTRRPRRPDDAWTTLFTPDAQLVPPVLDDGPPRRRAQDDWTRAAPDDPPAAPVDLLAPTLDDGARQGRRTNDGWSVAFAPDTYLALPVLDDGAPRRRWQDDSIRGMPQDPPAAPVDLLAPWMDDGAARPAQADAQWIPALTPDAAADLFSGMLDDGAAAARRWADECATGTLPQDAPAAADLFAAVLDDGFVRRRPADALCAYLPPDVDAPAPGPAPQPAISAGGGHARQRPQAYDRADLIARQNQTILAVIVSAITSGILQ